MRKTTFTCSLLLVFFVLMTTAGAQTLQGFYAAPKSLSEVPAVSSGGAGLFRALLSEDEAAMNYILNYTQTEGEVTQAHIHFAQAGVNGGVVLFLCTNLSPPADVPEPPGCDAGGEVSGILSADNVFGGAADQGIATGEWEKVIAAMRSGHAYVNIHTDVFPGGELRGQIDSVP